jgi:hypothetical protein
MSKINIFVLFMVMLSCSTLFGVNNALDFSSSTGTNVNCGSATSLKLLGNFTMEAWIKPAASGFSSINSIMGNRTAGNSGSGLAFYVNDWNTTSLDLVVESKNKKATSINGVITRGVWQHVATTYDGSNIKFYVNGAQVATMNNYYASTTPSETFKIGVLGGEYYGFTGAIDEVRVWNIARNPADIGGSYNHELIGNETGLVAYYKFDEGTGSTVEDASVNSNNGSFGFNAPSWISSGIDLIEVTEYPNLATLIAPTTESLAPINTQLQWSYDGPEIDGFELAFDGGEAILLSADVSEYDLESLAYNKTYEWTVTPYISPDTKPQDEIETWSFKTTNLYIEETPQIIQGTPVSVTLSAVITGTPAANWTPNGPEPLEEPSEENPLIYPLPENQGDFVFGASISQAVAGSFTYTFLVPGGDYTGVAFLDGEEYFTGTWLGGIVTVEIPFTGAKDIHEVVITTDNTLPVTLSSFTAIQTSNNLAKISWVTASENGLLGYNLFRSESENQDDALRVTATIIEATNSPSGWSYSYLDSEVEMDVNYHYWLQTNDFNGTTEMFGPVLVKISSDEDNDIEEMMLGTQMFANYPNPFNPSTTISFSVAEAQVVTIDVYNCIGQHVKSLFNANVSETNVKHSVVWNGLDSNNQNVASGIYFTIMKAGNKRFSNKTILVK